MKAYIFADMEGVSGISAYEFVDINAGRYQTGCRYLTADINACVRGCFTGGAEAVLVKDGHWNGRNILWDELDPRVELLQGNRIEQRLPGIEECDALILLGYHAMAGTRQAVLHHTYDISYQRIWLNDRLTGEFALDAGVASDRGIPTILVTGDDKICSEAQGWIPNIVTCQVKTGINTEAARLLPMPTAHRLIEEKAAEAVRSYRDILPLQVQRPVKLRMEKGEWQALPLQSARPDLTFIDNRTCEVTADTVEQAIYLLTA